MYVCMYVCMYVGMYVCVVCVLCVCCVCVCAGVCVGVGVGVCARSQLKAASFASQFGRRLLTRAATVFFIVAVVATMGGLYELHDFLDSSGNHKLALGVCIFTSLLIQACNMFWDWAAMELESLLACATPLLHGPRLPENSITLASRMLPQLPPSLFPSPPCMPHPPPTQHSPNTRILIASNLPQGPMANAKNKKRQACEC